MYRVYIKGRDPGDPPSIDEFETDEELDRAFFEKVVHGAVIRCLERSVKDWNSEGWDTATGNEGLTYRDIEGMVFEELKKDGLTYVHFSEAASYEDIDSERAVIWNVGFGVTSLCDPGKYSNLDTDSIRRLREAIPEDLATKVREIGWMHWQGRCAEMGFKEDAA